MSLTPAFEIGIWNAWILVLLFYLSMFIPDLFLGKDARKKSKRMSQFPPFEKIDKILAVSTHAVIMPIALIYSIFLPLKLGTAWLYAGLGIYAASLILSLATIFSIASGPAERPVTGGVYKFSRHPIYSSGFLMFISVGVACASWVVLFLAAVWIVFWQIVVPEEEKFLIEKYGDDYRNYLNRTPRWIGLPKSSISS